MHEEESEQTIDDVINRLTKTFQQLTDPLVKKHFVARRIADMTDAEAVEALHRLQIRAVQGDAASNAVISAGLDVGLLAEEIGKGRVRLLCQEAEEREYASVLNLFRTLMPVKKPDGDENAFLEYGLSNQTLGERKSAARSLDRDTLNRVGYDVDPDVIRQLLLNPRLTEKDVVSIAARRPNHPEIIVEIYRSPKWKARPDVRIAIIRNPYTPPQLAIALIPTLLRQQLREVIIDTNVHENVRQIARQALEIKMQALKPGGEDADEAGGENGEAEN